MNQDHSLNDDVQDKDRRNWLIATSAVGGVGAAAALYPFVDSFEPSERAKAAGAA
ncbi:ubiquinol-cytochrome c reductase iron-sulfur subunit N-terminal domain-containing protein, partial [Polynucleobacter sp. AP-Latsch-80-C2]